MHDCMPTRMLGRRAHDHLGCVGLTHTNMQSIRTAAFDGMSRKPWHKQLSSCSADMMCSKEVGMRAEAPLHGPASFALHVSFCARIVVSVSSVAMHTRSLPSRVHE